jgi:hypothetical protein
MAKIGAWWLRKQEAREGEEVQWSSLANRFQGSVSVGGKLFLTQSRLLFNPHLIDGAFRGKPWQVALPDVQEGHQGTQAQR